MNEAFVRVARAHGQRYPLMMPQDYGKLAYQNALGPGHFALTPREAHARLAEEWAALSPQIAARPAEDIGNGLCRFHLTGAYAPEEAAPLLAELFCRTAREHVRTLPELAERLDTLAEMEVPGMQSWLAAYRKQGCPPIGHSEGFREAYAPHYRVLQREYACFFPALLAVWRLVQGQAAAFVAIDGRCGSGKTALAALIAQIFSGNVFHMDDFYLPPAERSPDWSESPGGNMDFARLRREVLQPLADGAAVSYRPFDCQSGRLLAEVTARAQPLTVLEGSYALHPQLGAPCTLKICLTCSPAEQERRLKAREGDYFPMFAVRWIPLEEQYLQSGDITAQCDMLIDTSDFWPAE